MAGKRRRQAGEGSIGEYTTKAGPRYLIKYTARGVDGSQRVVLKRGFPSRRAAAAALRAELRKIDMGEWVEPSKQRLDAYLAEWRSPAAPTAGRAIRPHRPLRLHDPASRAHRRGQAGPAGGQSDRPVHAAEPLGGTAAGDAGLDRRRAEPLPPLGRKPDPDLAMGWRLLAATGCVAVRPWPCAGGMSTSMRPAWPCGGASAR